MATATSRTQPDVLRLFCRLGPIARDLDVEFEVRYGALRGRIGIGGLDEGARKILEVADEQPQPCHVRRLRRARRRC